MASDIIARTGILLSVSLLLLALSSISSIRSDTFDQQSIGNNENLKRWDPDVAAFGPAAESWSQRRVLLQEADNSTGAGTNGRPLAVKGGRLDPFDGFRKYRGGYDVESKHYWGSVAFTGIFGYALGAAWLLLGVILGTSYCCLRYCCCKRKSRRTSSLDPPQVSYCWLAVLSVVLLTVGALGGCVALYIGDRHFTVEARNVEETLNRASDNATGTIGNITAAITQVQQLVEPYETSANTLEIVNTKARLINESQSIQQTVDDNTDIFHDIITAMEAALIVVTTLNVIVIIMGPVSAVFKWRRIFYFIVVVGWILAVLNSFLFGLYFMFNNAVEDTCDAMNEYMDRPYNTTLDALLPCEDLLSASDAVDDIAKEIRDAVSSVNATLNLVQLLGYKLSPLCEQIGPAPEYQYISSCPNNTVNIGDLPKELEPLRCSSNDSREKVVEGDSSSRNARVDRPI
ncbi:hypothetical protein AXG93_3037s1130 [Marchantia polymorpha subsp. ruderalis]|uniref:Protein tweety homolog n=1 Tax=Marchantia polymorpha subsp. ruderalis TaxID=1480154 RepID=A0A176WL50_MARPO|nr:hypothetical protein AXG93_3037s1130 [Marchantia polymorpha subsp. ruderalis]